MSRLLLLFISLSFMTACTLGTPPPADNPPSGTNTPLPQTDECIERSDWTYMYTIEAGVTLSYIADLTGTTVAEIVDANCLINTDLLQIGQVIRLPSQPIIGDGPGAGPPPGDLAPIPTKVSTDQVGTVSIDPFVSMTNQANGIVTMELQAGSNVFLTWENPPEDSRDATWQYVTEADGYTNIGTGLVTTWTVPVGADGGIVVTNSDGMSSPLVRIFSR